MRDDKLTAHLFAECKCELDRLRLLVDEIRQKMDCSYYPKYIPPIFECQKQVMLIMERLASGAPMPPGKTAWDHVNKDEK